MTRKTSIDEGPQLLRPLKEVALFQGVQTGVSPPWSSLRFVCGGKIHCCLHPGSVKSKKGGKAACSWTNKECREHKGRKEQRESDLHRFQVTANHSHTEDAGKKSVPCYLGIPLIPADGKMATRIQDGDGRWTGWWVKMMLPSLINLASFLQGFQNINRLEWICFLN